MMKLNLILISTLINAYSAFSADPKPVVYSGLIQTEKGTSPDSTLQKLLTIKGVDTQYAACLKVSSIEEKDIPKCIWDGIPGSSPGPLADNIKAEVKKSYELEGNKDASRSPASSTASGISLTAKSKQLTTDYMSDPAVIALADVFKAKLEEALLGDAAAQKDTKSVVSVDHSKFIELYKTELGKTIVSAFTSYCMEVDTSATFKTVGNDCSDVDNNKIPCDVFLMPLPKNRKDKIEANIASLKDSSLKSSTKTVANPYSDKWSSCIASVSRVCYGDIPNPGKPDDLTAQIALSKVRACTLMDYVKSARKNLIYANAQDDFYKDLAKNNSGLADIGNARAVQITDKNTKDAATTLTSKDIELSYEVKNKALEKEIAECVDNGKILNAEKCKKFINTDADEKKKDFAEFGLRQFALGDEIDKKLGGNKDEVKKYLKEEGYTDDKIKAMLTSDADIATVKAEITKRYASERDALIATMADKIKKKTTDKEGLDASSSTDSSKLDEIRKDISSRSSELKQLVHFNNIVSSYLEIDSDGKKSRNVASLYAEINNSATKIDGAATDEIKEITKNSKEAGLDPNKDKGKENGDAATNLSVDTLNNIFKYSTEK
jgi:hypothetical protein